MSQRSWRRIIDDLAREFGAAVELTGGSHLKVTIPGCSAVYCGGSPTSEYREAKNVRAALRRAKASRKP